MEFLYLEGDDIKMNRFEQERMMALAEIQILQNNLRKREQELKGALQQKEMIENANRLLEDQLKQKTREV